MLNRANVRIIYAFGLGLTLALSLIVVGMVNIWILWTVTNLSFVVLVLCKIKQRYCRSIVKKMRKDLNSHLGNDDKKIKIDHLSRKLCYVNVQVWISVDIFLGSLIALGVNYYIDIGSKLFASVVMIYSLPLYILTWKCIRAFEIYNEGKSE